MPQQKQGQTQVSVKPRVYLENDFTGAAGPHSIQGLCKAGLGCGGAILAAPFLASWRHGSWKTHSTWQW